MMRSARFGLWSLFLIPTAALAAPVQPVVTGTVLTEDGRSLAGAQVGLLPVVPAFEQARHGLDAAGEPVPAATAVSDAAGRFSLQAPRSGIWKVVVRSAGRVPVQQSPLPLVAPVELAPAMMVPDAEAALLLTGPSGGGWRSRSPSRNAPRPRWSSWCARRVSPRRSSRPSAFPAGPDRPTSASSPCVPEPDSPDAWPTAGIGVSPEPRSSRSTGRPASTRPSAP